METETENNSEKRNWNWKIFRHLNHTDLPTVSSMVDRKKLIDEDDREIRLLQEQFLPDGDLHSDSIGRMRRFRWNNLGMSLANCGV